MTSFSRIFRNQVLLLLTAAAMAACTGSAGIMAEIKDAGESEIVLRQQNINKFDILDTVRTDAAGRFRYKVKLEKGNPDFIYIYRNDRKLASLLLQSGDKVHVVADTAGNYSVEGSAESEKLRLVEKDYADFSAKMDSLANELSEVGNDAAREAELSSEMAGCYTGYYRKCVKYVMSNSRSLTVVPVFYQTVAGSFYVFSQDTDALHFANVADSLALAYPDSKYVKALEQEAASRRKQLELRVRLQTAEEIGYPQLELPDVHGKKVKISDLDAKAVLLYFWSPDNALQKMANLDVLKKIYSDYKGKGLEIYQVAIAVDKPAWERIVTAQGLGWTNVCDGLGENSPVIGQYNLNRLPAYFLIVDGQLSDRAISDEKTLRKALDQIL